MESDNNKRFTAKELYASLQLCELGLKIIERSGDGWHKNSKEGITFIHMLFYLLLLKN